MISPVHSAATDQYKAVNRAFTSQSTSYDEADLKNPILRDMRAQVYEHVNKFLKPKSHILELNAGTGIDAVCFASSGHNVVATDLSDGMIRQIRQKIERNNLSQTLSCQQLSYEEIDTLADKRFDFVFSNFGGLNCLQNLSKVTIHLPAILKPGAYVTWVIMPPVCFWEILGLLKGKNQALRRLQKPGTTAHLEGEYFQTYYHSLSQIKKAFDSSFTFIKSEGLAALSPPPYHSLLPHKYPRVYTFTRKVDALLRHSFPFNRWADHIIVTFQYTP